MPIRTATLTRQIQKNGARLHRAMAISARSHRSGQPPSELEHPLLEERRLLRAGRLGGEESFGPSSGPSPLSGRC
jgi:hypothetical protein